MSDDGNVVSGLDALRADYTRRVPEKLQALREALRQAREHHGDLRRLAAARTLAHRLSGTAGSYGHAEIGEAAAGIEAALINIEKATGLVEESWAEIDRRFADASRIASASGAG